MVAAKMIVPVRFMIQMVCCVSSLICKTPPSARTVRLFIQFGASYSSSLYQFNLPLFICLLFYLLRRLLILWWNLKCSFSGEASSAVSHFHWPHCWNLVHCLLLFFTFGTQIKGKVQRQIRASMRTTNR